MRRGAHQEPAFLLHLLLRLLGRRLVGLGRRLARVGRQLRKGVLRLGEYEKIFVLNADLAIACGVTEFCEKYPEDDRQRSLRSPGN